MLESKVEDGVVSITTDGTESSEYKSTQFTIILSYIAVLAGAITSILPNMLVLAPADSKWARIGGGLVTLAGSVGAYLAQKGYTDSRIALKKAMATAAVDAANGPPKTVTNLNTGPSTTTNVGDQ